MSAASTRAADRPSDTEAMRIALEAAAGVRHATSPRPWVGAVVYPGAFVGATEGREGRHAEVVALSAAGEAARGATLFVTLEPCAHTGKTPPCVDAIIEAGVARVVVGVRDPDPRVNGRGIAALREAGVEVDVGVAESEVSEQLAPYLHHRRTGRPYVVLKLALTLDGYIADASGESRWITSEAARADAHRLRAESDAVLVGAGTVRRDDPRLTVRHVDLPGARDPMRVVLGRVPPSARVMPAIEHVGDLEELLDRLGASGVLQLLVEGGSRVAGEFHRRGLVDRYVLYLAPALFGGEGATSAFGGGEAVKMSALWRGRFVQVRRLGPDLRVDLVPEHGV
ncbi:MAG: putative bifunctional riboflavin biosynthesis protein RibG [Acidimicrobiales bacterium]|nr:MAG: putative bifunctional riboflavin biosynthesis protein RibG [Acidimicrobiales bacterium]